MDTPELIRKPSRAPGQDRGVSFCSFWGSPELSSDRGVPDIPPPLTLLLPVKGESISDRLMGPVNDRLARNVHRTPPVHISSETGLMLFFFCSLPARKPGRLASAESACCRKFFSEAFGRRKYSCSSGLFAHAVSRVLFRILRHLHSSFFNSSDALS